MIPHPSPSPQASIAPTLRRALRLLSLLTLTACSDPDTPSAREGLIVELERLAVSPTPTAAQIVPYDEALVFHSYTVKSVLHGTLTTQQIQLGHWAFVEGQAQPIDTRIGETIQVEILPLDDVKGTDDLFHSNTLDDYHSPLFVQVPAETQPVADEFRTDYGGPISKQMRLYWGLRDQLRVVAIGNSRTGVGLLPGQFFPDINTLTPIGLNLSPPGSNLELQALLAKEYLAPLPALKWVVWGISPRYFNTHRREEDRTERFTDSPGYRYDQQNADELWPIAPATTLQTTAQVIDWCSSGTDAWGAATRPDSESIQLTDPTHRQRFLDLFSIVRFRTDDPQWTILEDTLDLLNDRSIHVLLFTPPTHPISLQAPATDPDGTGPKHNAEVVRRLQQLDDRYPNIEFEDVHQAGAHGFPFEDFSDAGHLDHSGAVRLTQRIAHRLHQWAAELD